MVTGPTGAGKTTTLYSTLIEILTPEKSVVTVEDPVEYQIDGATQVQINPKAGLTWSTALKSILRADPDIVLIGEIRTTDTAIDRDGGGPERPPGAHHAPHEHGRRHPAAAHRDGHRALPRDLGGRRAC